MKSFIESFLKLDDFWSITGYIFIVIFVSWIIYRILRLFIILYIKSRRKDRFGRTSIQFLRNSIRFFIGIFAIIYIVATVPVLRGKAAFIFSGAGILAAIIGFAAQAAISNLIAGAFIVIFRPFRVGDYIKLDNERIGIVEDITLRHTIINNFENKRLIIPNSVISTESVLNHTIDDSYILSFNNFKVGLNADTDLARKIILEEVKKLNHVLDKNFPSEKIVAANKAEVIVIDISESSVHLRAYVWIDKPFQEFKIKCQLKESVHKRFLSEGVDLPIPIRKVI